MKRRDFLVLLASLVSTRAASQSAPSLPAVAFLGFATEESDRPAVEAFRKGLAEQGLVHGQTIELVTRHAGGDLNVAADLIRDADPQAGRRVPRSRAGGRAGRSARDSDPGGRHRTAAHARRPGPLCQCR